MMNSVFNRVENTVRRGENAGSKTFDLRVVKGVEFGKFNTLPHSKHIYIEGI